MRINLFSDAGSYHGFNYFYDTETNKYYVEEYMWHIDDSMEVLETDEVSTEWVLNHIKDKSMLYASARVNQYCGINTTSSIMEIIEVGEEKRKKYWEKTAADVGLFTLKRTKPFERQKKPGDFRRIRNKIENQFELEFLICNSPYFLVYVVFDENCHFLYYELTWYIRQKESIRIDIETETKYLLSKGVSDPGSFRITNNLIDVLRVNSQYRPVSETVKRIKDLEKHLSDLTQKTYFDILTK